MLNMLLAMIMDVYTEVKGNIGSGSETLLSQALEIFLRQREVRKGRQVTLSYVLKVLDPTDLDEGDDEVARNSLIITVADLSQMVPSLPEAQALIILTGAIQMDLAKIRPPESLTDSMGTIRIISDRLHQVHFSLERLIHMNEMGSTLVANTSHAERAERRLTRTLEQSQTWALGAIVPDTPQSFSVLAGLPTQIEELLRRHEDLLRKYSERCDRLEASQTALVKAVRSAMAPEPAAPLPANACSFGRICGDPVVRGRHS